MNQLTQEKKMTISEVAEIFNVTPEAIKKHVRKLFPEIIENGKTTYLNEKQVTIIKLRMQPTTEVVANKTDLEKELLIIQAMQFQQEKINKLKAEIENQMPAVEFYNAVTDSKDAISMNEVAKVLNCGIGRNRLFQILRKEKVLMLNNTPKQTYIDREWFRVIEQKYSTGSETHINLKTVVYQKGIDGILKLLKVNNYIEVK